MSERDMYVDGLRDLAAHLQSELDTMRQRLDADDTFIRGLAADSDESDDELREALTDWDHADVYRFTHDAIIGARRWCDNERPGGADGRGKAE